MSRATRRRSPRRSSISRPKLIVGAGGAKTRDDALELGEARPDYMFFGRFGYDNKPEPHPRNLSLGAWWAEMIQIPCIVMAGSDIASVEAVAATGAEFVALSSACSPRASIRRPRSRGPTRILDETAPRLRGLSRCAGAACLLAAAWRVLAAGVAQPAPPAVADSRRTARDASCASGGLTATSRRSRTASARRRPTPAYGAFQRGLYITAYNLALPRAENGDPAAQTLVAEILSRGLGAHANEAEAAKWYQRAAEQGVPEAQFQYALMLLDGRFVTKDPKGAYALMQAAAEAGNRLAQFNFAQMLVDREPGDRRP